eukprot:TRINITY_DN3500_c0_g1_i10.p1 TRINITY_DN3500_c0_g1~~TRINITY_DN3500_c0_g1_i10.p1  ORF type:complete len:393 (-),score=53.89 TRINITY_DN3500_c0_g1_i10:95-1273(-)
MLRFILIVSMVLLCQTRADFCALAINGSSVSLVPFQPPNGADWNVLVGSKLFHINICQGTNHWYNYGSVYRIGSQPSVGCGAPRGTVSLALDGKNLQLSYDTGYAAPPGGPTTLLFQCDPIATTLAAPQFLSDHDDSAIHYRFVFRSVLACVSQCPAGSYATTATNCALCVMGTYQPLDNAPTTAVRTCFPCPDFGASVAGAVSAQQCVQSKNATFQTALTGILQSNEAAGVVLRQSDYTSARVKASFVPAASWITGAVTYNLRCGMVVLSARTCDAQTSQCLLNTPLATACATPLLVTIFSTAAGHYSVIFQDSDVETAPGLDLMWIGVGFGVGAVIVVVVIVVAVVVVVKCCRRQKARVTSTVLAEKAEKLGSDTEREVELEMVVDEKQV